MRGYTLEQLESRGANAANYVGCVNCRLHWHRRVFERHFNPGPETLSSKEIEIIHPTWARFLDFLAESAVKKWYSDDEDRRRRGEPAKASTAPPTRLETENAMPTTHILTVDEAVQPLGLSRDEIMAEFERRAVPFEVQVPRAPSRRGKRRTTEGSRRPP